MSQTPVTQTTVTQTPVTQTTGSQTTGSQTTGSQTTGSARDVGVDLQENDENRAVITAIEADNPGCGVRHMPGLVRITNPGRLVITRESVETQLGREWETHEFQLAIVSYFGHIKEWDDDQITIQWDH